MLGKILIVYGMIALVLFILGVIFGKCLKKDVLGRGVRLGIVNSFLLASVWPITLMLALVGFIYDTVKVWKKL